MILTAEDRSLPDGNRSLLRLVDWIWTVRGSVPLPTGQSRDEAFDRLAPLFRERGTDYDRSDGTLTFTKKDQAAQDRMSVFDSGTLTVEQGATGATLRYRLFSRTLLFCFMLPLLFVGFAQLTVASNYFSRPSAEAKAAAAKKPEVKKPDVPMNWLDKALGAPAPEKKKDDKKKDDDDKPTTTPAYVFAAMFVALYAAGRVLEDRLVKRLFGRHLLGA